MTTLAGEESPLPFKVREPVLVLWCDREGRTTDIKSHAHARPAVVIGSHTHALVKQQVPAIAYSLSCA